MQSGYFQIFAFVRGVASPTISTQNMSWAFGRFIAFTLVGASLLGAGPAQSQTLQTDAVPIHGTGLIPDSKADLKNIPQVPGYRGFQPEQVDLTRYFPQPGDQGQQGSCTAWAVGYAARAYYARSIEGRNIRSASNIPSPAFIYGSIKEGDDCEHGTSIRKALELLKRDGTMSLQQFPYNQASCPRPDHFESSQLDFKIVGFDWIDPQASTPEQFLEKVKHELANNNPVILSIRTTDAFDQLKRGQIYRYPTTCTRPAKDRAPDGDCYHAITAVGYDEHRQAIKLLNSWGPDWADDGFTWIAYEIFPKEVQKGYVMKVELPPPPTCALSVSPASIVRGDTAVLSYTSNNANEGTINNGIGDVSSSGSITIAPTKSENYSARFIGRGGNVTCTAAVTVTEPVPKPDLPAIVSFSVSPSHITAGQSAKLSWSVEKATLIKIDPGFGTVKDTSISVLPESTTTYTLTATNSAGTVTSNAVVMVSPRGPIALPDVGCGKVAVVDHAGKSAVVGFVGKDEDLEKIRAASKGAQVDVDVRPFPQCEAMLTLEKALSSPDRPRVSIKKSSGNVLTAGDDLVFEIQTPPYPSFLHVAYIQADDSGHYSVVNLIQPGIGSLTAYPPNTRLVLGNDPGARRFRVSAPFGREMLVVLAGRSPVFPERRPDRETEREFLTALRRVLIAKPDAAAPERDVVAGYDTIITAERKSP